MNQVQAGDAPAPPTPKLPPIGTYDTVEDHLEAYKRIRDEGACVWDEYDKTWLAASYDTAKSVFMDPSKFTRTEPNLAIGGARQILALRGEDHKRMRRWYLQLFTPRNAESWEEGLIRPALDGAIRKFAQRGKADIYSEYAQHLGLQVISRLLGLPHDDDEWLQRFLRLIETQRDYLESSAGWFEIDNEEQRKAFQKITADAIAGNDEMKAMVEPYLLARKEIPTDDVISKLWADQPLEGWNIEDTFSVVRNIFFGAVDTTKFALTNLLWLVLSHPGLKEEIVKGDKEFRERVVEEGLRLLGPTQFRPRIVAEDMKLGNAELHKGDTIAALQLCADRDESHFPGPDEIDLNRPAPRDHLAFGSGYAICLGAALARVELRVALERILHLLPDIELDPDAEQPIYDGFLHKYHHPLHVRFTPREV